MIVTPALCRRAVVPQRPVPQWLIPRSFKRQERGENRVRGKFLRNFQPWRNCHGTKPRADWTYWNDAKDSHDHGCLLLCRSTTAPRLFASDAQFLAVGTRASEARPLARAAGGHRLDARRTRSFTAARRVRAGRAQLSHRGASRPRFGSASLPPTRCHCDNSRPRCCRGTTRMSNPLRILVCEDNEDLRDLLVTII